MITNTTNKEMARKALNWHDAQKAEDSKSNSQQPTGTCLADSYSVLKDNWSDNDKKHKVAHAYVQNALGQQFFHAFNLVDVDGIEMVIDSTAGLIEPMDKSTYFETIGVEETAGKYAEYTFPQYVGKMINNNCQAFWDLDQALTATFPSEK